MALQSLTVALTSGTPVALVGDGLHGVIRVRLRNQGTGIAYLGSSGVTTGGYPLTSADSPLDLTIYGGETLYGASTGTPSINVLRMNDTTV